MLDMKNNSQVYNVLFENPRDAIFVYDLNGRFLDANHSACKRLGYSLEELQEMTLADIDPIEYSHLKPERTNPLHNEPYVIFETIHVSSNGKVIPTEITVQYVVYDGQKAYLSIARDVSDHKSMLQRQRKTSELAQAFMDTAVAINHPLHIDQALNHILDNIRKAIPFELATIMSVGDQYAEVIEVRQEQNHSKPQTTLGLRIRIADFSTLTYMMETQRALALSSAIQYPGWVETTDAKDTYSYVGAPICTDGQVIGFINLVGSQGKPYAEKDAEYLQAFAAYAAVAMKNAQLVAELEYLTAHIEEQVQRRTDKVRHEIDRFEAVFHNSADNILLVNLDGTIEMTNPQFNQTFGLDETNVVGHSLLTVLPIQEKAALDKYWNTILNNGESARQQLEATAEKKDGSPIDVEINLAPVKNGSVSGVVCSIRNTTPFKEAARAKDAFVSNVSHELKTPINSIGLYRELLHLNPDRQEVYLTRIERETNRLNHLLDDLLCLSRLDQNRMTLNYSRFDLNCLVSNLVEDRQLMVVERNLDLKLDSLGQLPLVTADAGLIEQVVSILLTNAINYSAAKGQIVVSTCLCRRGDLNWCGVSIRDSGPGIVLDEQPKIFERFYRGKTGIASQTAGTGLGLAIAAEIITRHQGEIELHSDGIPGQGSTFTIWLPVHS